MDKTQFTQEELAELKKSALKSRFNNAKALPEGYAKRLAASLAKELTKHPDHYMLFGVYWWGFKNMLIKCGQKGWWTNGYFDPSAGYNPDIDHAGWEGMIYREYNLNQSSHIHYKLGSEGEAVPYFLFDYDAGC